MNILSINNLEVCHGQLQAVRGISLDIKSGEVVALGGATGAGKTSLLRAIAGAHKASQGSVVLNGDDVTAMPSHRRVRAGLTLVPEGRLLFKQMTVEENLLLGMVANRPGFWTIDQVYKTFPNIVPRRHTKTALLSGGEQQATAIGRALLSNPEVILLDEVSLGLSPAIVDRVYASLNSLLESGTTIVLVEQDLERSLRMASRVICLLEGEVVLDRMVGDVSRDQITQAYFGLHKSAREGERRSC